MNATNPSPTLDDAFIPSQLPVLLFPLWGPRGPRPENQLTGKSLLAYSWCVGDVFKALADPTRRIILDELAERDGQTLFEICGRLLMIHGLSSSRQAVSQHLDVLEGAGLVQTRREGRHKFHYINTNPIEPIVERWLNRSGDTW